MISIHNLSKQYGEHTLFKNMTFAFERGSVVGIVGENGVGKTTLLKIICGEIKPDSGHVDFGGERIGYVPQFFEFATNTSVEEFLYAVNPDVKEYEIKKALFTVSLNHLKRNTPINVLSGGQKTRLYFASLLLAKFPPTFLILDEPTNNLDVEGIEWLEDFLTAFDGGVILASHDRAFLDTVASQIIEIHDGGVKLYGGNYSFYREQKEIEEEAYRKKYAAQQKNIRHIEENVKMMKERAQIGEVQFSSRMPYQRAKIRKSAAQAVYRQKRLEKFLKSQTYLEKPEVTVAYPIGFAGEAPHGKSLIYAEGVTKTYNGKTMINSATIHIGGSERIWLRGKNGSGKTSLLRILAGQIMPNSGKVEVGAGVTIGYFSQDKNDLIQSRTLFEELMSTGISQTESYKIAMRFKILPSDLTKLVGEASAGQQAKISFAKLLCGGHSLLILDEPTNHLEIETRERIEDALNNYTGSFIVSSHDRYFIDAIGINRTCLLQDGELM